MKHFSRPYRSSFQSLGLALLLGIGVAMAPPASGAQTANIAQFFETPAIPLLHSSTQGYLGVLVGDVDSESAPKLKLKEVRGAVVTLIDHDAPAAQAGIRVNDVLLKLDGQVVEGAEQFGRMLREVPAGRTISLEISRDGNLQTIAVELADRKKIEHDVWNKIGDGGDVFTRAPQGMGILAGGSGDTPTSGGFHLPFFGSSLNVGALVEPLTSQMADYLGVQSGLMVKQVARKSDAATAGLKAFDVILKVGSESITTVSDWERALRSNQGKTVQVTILRDKKQQTLSLQVDEKHHRGELEDLFPLGDCPLVAMLDPEVLDPDSAELPGWDAEAAAEQMRQQAEKLSEQLGAMPVISQEQAEAMRQQAEKLRESLQSQDFELNQKQLDQLKQQMEEFRKNFKPEDFKLDPREMDQLRQQMEQFRNNFKPEDFKIDPKQMDELKQQMEQLKRQMREMQLQGFDNHV